MVKLPEDVVEPLARFERGATVIREAIYAADAGALSRPNAEGWSVRDILVHLSDAEMVRATRIRMILADDEPPLFTFDEGMWKRKLHYLWRSPEAAIALFDQLRFTTVEILRQLDMKGWGRAGIMPDGVRLTVGELIIRGANHSDEHAEQIRPMRGR
ncbi:MAG: DinB family protein [Tepidiformaceae bacterium]